MAALGTLLKQTFAKDIQNSLWPVNDFLSQCKDDTMFVNDDKVNLPHAGTTPTVAEGMRTAIATPGVRNDSVTQYELLPISSDPTWLRYNEELIVNYNKRDSILSEHRNALQKSLAERVAFKWARGGDTTSSTNWTNKPTRVMTTGADRAVLMPIHAGGSAGTGYRSAVTFQDILNVLSVMNYSDYPADRRIAVIPSAFFSDLLQIEEFKSSDYVNVKPLPGAPTSFSWLGFTWYVRSFVTAWTNAGTPLLQDTDTASAVTDCAGALFYHKDAVRAAKGDVKVFLNIDMANLYGSQMSAEVRYGAIGARKDGAGIVNLVESYVSS